MNASRPADRRRSTCRRPRTRARSSIASRATSGMFKVGSQLFTAAGPDARARDRGARREGLPRPQVPRHPEHGGRSASRAPRGSACRSLTVHGLGGRAMLEAAVGALPAMGTRLLAITILTSHDEATLAEIGVGGGADATPCAGSRRLAKEAGDGRRRGVAARGRARPRGLRPRLPDRDAGHPAGGRRERATRRAPATPAAALAAGADYLVVGRPITEADDPGGGRRPRSCARWSSAGR